MTQTDNTEAHYGDGNPIPLTAIALEVAKELDIEITPISESGFSFKALDDHSGPFNAYVASKGDQVWLDLPLYSAQDDQFEMGDGETVSTREEAVQYLKDIFEQSQAADA